MKFRLILSCVAGLLASWAVTAQADVAIAQITNNQVTSGSCTIQSNNGGTGWISYKISCGADVAYVTQTNPNTYNCALVASSAGYYPSGTCNSYTVYKSTPSSSSSSSSSTPSWVKLTDVTNTMTSSNPNCTVQSAGGMGYANYTYVGYRVVCGSTVASVTLTYNNTAGTCSVNSAPAGFMYSGSCNSYTVYQQQ